VSRPPVSRGNPHPFYRPGIELTVINGTLTVEGAAGSVDGSAVVSITDLEGSAASQTTTAIEAGSFLLSASAVPRSACGTWRSKPCQAGLRPGAGNRLALQELATRRMAANEGPRDHQTHRGGRLVPRQD
jgi:hypothetical protein